MRTSPRKATQQRRTSGVPARKRPPTPTSADFASALIEHALDLEHIIDATETISYVSPAITRLLGYQPEDVQGKDCFSFVHPDDERLLREATVDLLRQPGSAVQREYRVRHNDGSWRIFEGVATNLLADPAVAGIVVNSRDITARAQTAVSLQESETRYRQLAEVSPNPVVVHAEGKLVYVNAAAVTFFAARSAEELIGKPVQDLVPQAFHAVQQQRIHQILAEGRATQFLTFPFLRLDGQTIEAEAAGMAITYAGKPAVQTVLRELTQPLQDDQALRASEERYRNLFENANDAIAAFTVDGIVTDVNRGAEVLLGWSREELIGQSYYKVLTPAARVTAEERTRRYLAGEDMSSIFEHDLVRKNGTIVPVEAQTRPIRDRTGQTVGFQGIYRDISERKKTEAALLESRHLLERIADMVPGIVYLYDSLTHQTVYVNRQVTQVLGYAPEQVLGTLGPFQPLLHPEDTVPLTEQQQNLATAADGVRMEAVYRVRHANGLYRWLQSRETVFRRTAEGHPTQIFGVAQDVTAQQRLQDRVQQRQIQREAIPQRLRAFRERLGVTQAEFGQRFGHFHPRQIGNYETGVADPPLDLLLAIQNQGYPLTAILGENPDTLLEETLGHLTSRYSELVIAQQLAETQRRLAEREGNKVAQILRELRLDPHPLTTPQRELLERLASLVSPDTTTGSLPTQVLPVTTARKRRARRRPPTPPTRDLVQTRSGGNNSSI